MLLVQMHISVLGKPTNTVKPIILKGGYATMYNRKEDGITSKFLLQYPMVGYVITW